MGVNDPKTWDKDEVDKETDRLNQQRATAAEIKLQEATRDLDIKMSPMPGVNDQAIHLMEVPIGEAHLINLHTKMLGRQHNRPIKALDLGTFTGHSAGAMARAIKEDGREGTVITCDFSDKYLPTAREYWKNEGIDHLIDFRLGKAGDTLNELLKDESQHNSFDIVFVDADKVGYPGYYEQALKLVRPGGQIIDNMLWSGRAADPDYVAQAKQIGADGKQNDPSLATMSELNDKIMKDPRVDAVMSNSDDGIMIVEKLGYAQKTQKSTEPRQL